MKLKRMYLLSICLFLIFPFIGCNSEKQASVEPDKPAVKVETKDKESSNVTIKEENEDTTKENKNSNSTNSEQPKTPSKNTEAKITFTEYQNPRYGFSIRYPDNFKLSKESANGDGAEFTFKDGSLIIYGTNNVLNETAKGLYENELKNIDKNNIIKKCQEKNYYIISYKEGRYINYLKSVVGEGSINSFKFTYLASKNNIYSDLGDVMSKDFKTPNINKVN